MVAEKAAKKMAKRERKEKEKPQWNTNTMAAAATDQNRTVADVDQGQDGTAPAEADPSPKKESITETYFCDGGESNFGGLPNAAGANGGPNAAITAADQPQDEGSQIRMLVDKTGYPRIHNRMPAVFIY
jgi:hypothetical protein